MSVTVRKVLYIIPILVLSLPFGFSFSTFIDLFFYELQLYYYSPNNVSFNPDIYLGLWIISIGLLSITFLIFMIIFDFYLENKTFSFIWLIISVIELLMGIFLTIFNRRNYYGQGNPWFAMFIIFGSIFLIIFYNDKIVDSVYRTFQ